MRSRERVAGAIVVALSACPLAAVAQERPVLRLSLEEAQARAVGASHALAEARARADGSEATVEASQAEQRPTVVTNLGYTRTNHVVEFTLPSVMGPSRVLYPDVPDNYFSRIELQWPIYTGGRLEALERASRAEAGASAAEVAMAHADLRLEVARAFWALVTARAAVAVLEQGVARSEANSRDVRERFEAGLVPPNEIASAAAQESRARMLAIQARNQQDLASADLARLTGIDLDQPVEPLAALDDPGLRPPSVARLLAEARAARQDRRAIQLRVESADEQQTAAAAGRRPTLLLSGGVDYARPNPRIFPRAPRWEDSWDAGVFLRWSLWDGGRTAAAMARASAGATAARERLAEFDSLLTLDVRQRVLEIESGRAAIDAATKGVRAALEARGVVQERYQAGVIAQIEVLNAEYALLQAELDRTRALADVRLAEARLERALGR